jgi:hypothetical protein
MDSARRPDSVWVCARLLGRGWAFLTSPSIRERRVLFLLAGAWLLSGFDLGFTLVARSMGSLRELNPVAAYLMGVHGDPGVVIYKVLLMVAGTLILWRYRHRPQAELSSCLVLLVYAALSVRWHAYYRDPELSEPILEALPIIASSLSTVPGTPAVPGPPDQTQMVDARSEAGAAARR